MLYKKIHRQYLREWRKGREFRFDDSGEECEIIRRGPYIRDNYIWADYGDVDYDDSDDLDLIHLTGPDLGQIWDKNDMIWLED